MTTAWPIYTNANLFFDKKKNGKLAQIYGEAYSSIFWWKKGTLKRNCPAAISKMRTTSITTKYFCHQPPKWTNIFFM